MLAHVIPLKRLPSSIGLLTYIVPPALEDRIAVGQLVHIPFRHAEIFGIVAQVEPTITSTATLKSINDIVHQTPLLSSTHLASILHVHEAYGTALGTTATLFAPPLQKRKLSAIELEPFPDPSTAAATATSVAAYGSPEEHQHLLSTMIAGTTLIVVPELHLIDDTVKQAAALSGNDAIAVWHSRLSIKDQFATWLAIRNGLKRVIIGTRSAMFLPFPHLDSLIIDYEHDEQHKHWDQFPRFDTRDMASLFQSRYGARVYRVSPSPSVESYYRLHTGEWAWAGSTPGDTTTIPTPIAERILATVKQKPTRFVDMRGERIAKNFSLFGHQVEEALETTAGDIFIYVPRRGFATSVGCHDCGFVFTCETCERPLVFHESSRQLVCHYCNRQQPMALSCPRCRSVVVNLRGSGTELVEKEVRRLLGTKNTHHIVRIDGDTDEVEPEFGNTACVIIGTDRATPHVRWDRTDTIVLLDLDHLLALPEYTATEKVWHRLIETAYLRRDDAVVYVQTYHLDHVVYRSLSEPDRFYRTELGSRKAFQYPPYTGLVRYIVRHHVAEHAERLAVKLQLELQQLLTKHDISGIIDNPVVMNPPLFRGDRGYVVVAKYADPTWFLQIGAMHKELTIPCHIDPRPLSILSPQ